MSAVTLLGNPAEMYNYGTQFVMIGISYIIVTPITAYLFVPVYYRLGLTSAYEVRILILIKCRGLLFAISNHQT
jgi:sodium-coupled monocarboxylate transporter 8/12